MAAVLSQDEHGNLVAQARDHGIVVADGNVRAADPIRVELPLPPHQRLERV